MLMKLKKLKRQHMPLELKRRVFINVTIENARMYRYDLCKYYYQTIFIKTVI